MYKRQVPVFPKGNLLTTVIFKNKKKRKKINLLYSPQANAMSGCSSVPTSNAFLSGGSVTELRTAVTLLMRWNVSPVEEEEVTARIHTFVFKTITQKMILIRPLNVRRTDNNNTLSA